MQPLTTCSVARVSINFVIIIIIIINAGPSARAV
jgi:hypothetical protein